MTNSCEHGQLARSCNICELNQRIKELEAENANLRTVMMAAAVEIQEHWDAHCDEEGYGPANLLRRLENGYPEQYGYNAETVVRMERRIAELEAALKRANSNHEEFERKWYLATDKVEELEAALDAALDALIWTTGSGDFGEGGIAHEGALKCLYPAINLLKELKK